MPAGAASHLVHEDCSVCHEEETLKHEKPVFFCRYLFDFGLGEKTQLQLLDLFADIEVVVELGGGGEKQL